MKLHMNTLGIDIGSTTVKIALLNKDGEIIFSDYHGTMPTSRKLLLLLLKKPMMNLVICRLLRSLPDPVD